MIIMGKKSPIGIALLLFSNGNGAPRLFTVEELKDKPKYSKFKGMISFPLETFEEDDLIPENTIKRLLQEEVGISFDDLSCCIIAQEVFHPIPGREDIDILYGYGIFKGNPENIFTPEDDDIKFAGWKTPDELLQQYVRVEVRPIIEHFQKNHFRELFGKTH